MNIMDKARELGRLIADSEEMLNLKESEAEIEQDDKSRRLMSEYKALQRELARATQEKRDKTVLRDLNQRLDDKYTEITGHDVTGRYLTAKSIFDSFVNQVNHVIIYSITGEEPCSHDKCGSCSGGCK